MSCYCLLDDEHSTQGGRRAHGPASQDVKAALQAIIADPDAADLQRVDSLTRALLMEPAWRRLRIKTLCALTGQQLGECAQYALDHFPAFRKPLVERAELMMALALLAAASAWHAARRNKLLREALALVFHADYRHRDRDHQESASRIARGDLTASSARVSGRTSCLPWVSSAVSPACGFANVSIWTNGMTMTVDFSDDKDRPFYIGLAQTLTAPATIIAPLIGGWIADSYGFTTTCALGTITFHHDDVSPGFYGKRTAQIKMAYHTH